MLAGCRAGSAQYRVSKRRWSTAIVCVCVAVDLVNDARRRSLTAVGQPPRRELDPSLRPCD